MYDRVLRVNLKIGRRVSAMRAVLAGKDYIMTRVVKSVKQTNYYYYYHLLRHRQPRSTTYYTLRQNTYHKRKNNKLI